MAKLYAICKMSGGYPMINQEDTPYHGHVLATQFADDWGCYIFSGTPDQMKAIEKLPDVFGVSLLSADSKEKQKELDSKVDKAAKDKVNK